MLLGVASSPRPAGVPAEQGGGQRVKFVSLYPAGTTGSRNQPRRVITPPSVVGKKTATPAHTCLMTPPPPTPLTRPGRPHQRPGRAASGHGPRTTAQGARRTAAAPPLHRDATETGRGLRLSWCSDHTHSWSMARTTTRPGETRGSRCQTLTHTCRLPSYFWSNSSRAASEAGSRSSEELSALNVLCRYVKTTANATVDHLSKYLALRVALEDRRADGEAEEAGREEGGRGEGPAGGGDQSSLNSVSEKQYTIYILTKGGQFSVSTERTNQAAADGME